MKRWFIILVVTGAIMASCSKSKQRTILTGSYKGTFQRQLNDTGAVSQVTITFADEAWQGQSSTSGYPVLCNGNKGITGNTINFANACIWTADFNWTIILNGNYRLVSNTDSYLEFRRNYPDGSKDIYKLTRQ